MSYTRLTVTRTNKIGHIQLSQPEEFNRMPPAFWQEFPEALQALDQDGDIRTVIISAQGKHFSSGMDTSVFTNASTTSKDRGRAGEQSCRRIAHFQEVFSILEDVRMPVIAAIQGGCLGGGVDLVSACDLRFCTTDAFFCIQEINIGMAADVGTLQRLPRLIPEGVMRELAYTGRRFHSDEALTHGLVNRVFDDHESMLKAAHDTAEQIASKSPLATHSTKHLLNYVRDHSVADALGYQQLWMNAVPQGGEMAKFFGAKAEGKEPEFDDLAPRKPKSLG